MTLKLHGTPTSTCTRRVATVLLEKNVPFEFVPVSIPKGENKTPEYLEKQPFGQVPYIDDDGFILYESRAICRYIVAKYANQGTPLIPTDPKALALFEQAVSIEQSDFDPHASGAVGEKVFKPYRGLVPDQAVFEKYIATLATKLEVYDRILAKQKYLAGNELTLADLFHLPYGFMLAVAGSDIMNSKPHVAKWFADVSSRPSWTVVKEGVKSFSG